MGQTKVMKYNELSKQLCKLYDSEYDESSGYCPPYLENNTFGVLCWNATANGTTARQPCPPYELFDTSAYAEKECWPNGTWYQLKDGSQYTNYAMCINTELYEFYGHINNLFAVGYSVSLVALLISLTIFLTFKSLQCTRIKIHIQLFISLALNNALYIIWYKVIIVDSNILKSNPVWCQAVDVLIHYTLIATYMWMFCESLYLHISLAVVFVRDKVAWKWFLVIGWGMPLVVITTYAMARLFILTDATDMCWVETTAANMLFSIVVLITLITSFVFFLNVLRVIITIMHPNSDNPATARVRRAARAAIILVPLFGLQNLLIPILPNKTSKYYKVHQYISVILSGCLGLVVSCIFCFANHDVRLAVGSFVNRQLYATGLRNYVYTGAYDSQAGVYVINGGKSSADPKEEETMVQLEQLEGKEHRHPRCEL